MKSLTKRQILKKHLSEMAFYDIGGGGNFEDIENAMEEYMLQEKKETCKVLLNDFEKIQVSLTKERQRQEKLFKEITKLKTL